MNRRSQVVLSLVAAFVAGVGLGGCTGNDQRDAVLHDLTPNLDTLHQRPEDVTNDIAIMFDENGRMFWQDAGRAFFWDRPSRLTREPVWRP